MIISDKIWHMGQLGPFCVNKMTTTTVVVDRGKCDYLKNIATLLCNLSKVLTYCEMQDINELRKPFKILPLLVSLISATMAIKPCSNCYPSLMDAANLQAWLGNSVNEACIIGLLGGKRPRLNKHIQEVNHSRSMGSPGITRWSDLSVIGATALCW